MNNVVQKVAHMWNMSQNVRSKQRPQHQGPQQSCGCEISASKFHADYFGAREESTTQLSSKIGKVSLNGVKLTKDVITSILRWYMIILRQRLQRRKTAI